MDIDGTAVSISAIVALVIIAIVAGSVYGCQSASERYYNLAHDCTAKSGSFIPVEGNGGNNAICLINRDVSK
jgi:hypothetical protein